MLKFKTGKERLSEEAHRHKKACLLCAIWLELDVDKQDRLIPAYDTWPRKKLQQEVRFLQDDFARCFGEIVIKPDSVAVQRAARWMADQYDRWQKRKDIMTLCTVQEFESEFGVLAAGSDIEVPPYAELLVQGWNCVAIRHPEYMLARDLEFLHALFIDAEQLITAVNWSAPPDWAGHASENGQALARAVIQACFNLLESFVSGLAQTHLMEHPNVPEGHRKKLLDQEKSLRQRIINVPEIIAGKPCGLQLNKPPLDRLFGFIKHRRDSFVHCEPGPQPSPRHGLVKEELFHDATKDNVDETVDLTVQVIGFLWRFLYNREGPRWLPVLPPTKPGRNLRLTVRHE